MSLASILLISLLTAPARAGYVTPAWTHQSQSTPNQPSAAAKQAQTSGSTSGTATAAQNGATGTANAPQSSSKPAKTSQKTKSKKNIAVNCNNATANKTASKGTPSNTAAAKATKTPASSECPPTKVIVQQGSTTESSIQVVGGAEGSQASDERHTAIQMLETTESNLKKIDETQLDSNQQDIVKQVRQFIDQSKAASSSGDLDQARTLAWKAQLLSEELLKPQK